MDRRSFRQWVACTVAVAMVFNMAAPLGLCFCEGCSCEKHISHLLSGQGVEKETHCCNTTGCNTTDTPPHCPCRCSDVPENDATSPAAVLSGTMSKGTPNGNMVSVLPAGWGEGSSVSSYLEKRRVSLSGHVPLHILLCVFLM